jgi:glycosyltransferase involved in cell wall biosynthesis
MLLRKVLWITPNILPEAAKKMGFTLSGSGGWLGSLIQLFEGNNNIEFHIITVNKKATYKKFTEKNITYYSISNNRGVFKYSYKLSRLLKFKVSSIKPDIIDFQGFEFCYMRDVDYISSGIPFCVTIQGLVSEINKYYLTGLSATQIFKSITIRDLLLFDSLFHRRNNYFKRGIAEKIAISKTKNFIGRTNWDHSIIKSYHSDFNYFSFKRKIRSQFYQFNWKPCNLSKCRLFLSQANAPFKGFHVLLNALVIIKKYFPSITVCVAGESLSKYKYNIPIFGGYQKLIFNLIHKYELKDNIEFLGPLDASSFADELSQSSLFVLPSLIENSPNSLIEAQICGVPSVVSSVGGTPSLLPFGYEFAYNSLDSRMLAVMIIELLSNYNKALETSEILKLFQQNYQSGIDDGESLINYYTTLIKN